MPSFAPYPAPRALPPKFDPALVKLEHASSPRGWLYAEYAPGKHITADMVAFDITRCDILVNTSGVVLFYHAPTARQLLGMAA